MKGIILAGGSGTRLYPLTKVTSKQLLPVYDKPMIYYPIATLCEANVEEILIISSPQDIGNFERLLGDGGEHGPRFCYAVQERPEGLAQAFIIAKDYLAGEAGVLILGDNIFCGDAEFSQSLKNATKNAENGVATIFGCKVKDPERFGVIGFDDSGRVTSIVEKPKRPASNYAASGLYFYPGDVCKKAATLTPSGRNELEITDLHNMYLKEDRLRVELLEESVVWFDAGTYDSLLRASNFVCEMQKKTGKLIGDLSDRI